jgi:hypothetical protein
VFVILRGIEACVHPVTRYLVCEWPNYASQQVSPSMYIKMLLLHWIGFIIVFFEVFV